MATLKNMNKEELLNHAQELGMDMSLFTEDMKKADIACVIQAFIDPAVLNHYSVNAMRPAIIKQWKIGNKKAIQKDDVIKEDIDLRDFDRWITDCKDFYEKTRLWVKDTVEHAKAEVIENDKGRAYACWRKLLKVGEESMFHKNMYIAETDMPYFFSFVHKFDYNEGIGTFQTSQGPTIFRKNVEALIGCRIADNPFMEDDDYELFVAYRNATKSLSNCERKLNGYDDAYGKHVLGILDNIKIVDERIKSVESKLTAYKLTEKEIADITAEDRKTLEDLLESKHDAEKMKKVAEQTIKTNQRRFEEISACYKPIVE